jgi:hypothetical protein
MQFSRFTHGATKCKLELAIHASFIRELFLLRIVPFHPVLFYKSKLETLEGVEHVNEQWLFFGILPRG